MADQKITVYADLSKEYMYDSAKETGLSEKAADYFKYFNEVELDLIVDSETGEVKEVQFPNDTEKEPTTIKNPCPSCGKEWDVVQSFPCPHCGEECPF